MTKRRFKALCELFVTIAGKSEPAKSSELDFLLYQGYVFMELTETQAQSLKVLLRFKFPDIYEEINENGYTGKFKHLLFK